MKLRYILLCFLYIILAPFVFGQASTIKINEFLIEPTPQIVELLNTGTEIIDLSNWYIDDNGGTTYFTIPTGTQLYPNACLSIEGSFNLNKTSADSIRLFDSTAPPTSSSANLIDSFEYKSSSGSGVTFQRIPDGQSIWSTGSANFDRYNLTGLSCKLDSSPTPTQIAPPTPTITSLPTASPLPTSVQATLAPSLTVTPGVVEASAIYLSEVYPYPNENENEWVELFNDNEYSVKLDGWKIDDVGDGGSSPKKFSITIPGYSFKVIDLSSSIFNNDGDDVRLLNSSDSIVDSFSYETAEKGKSIGRVSFSSANYCLQESSREYSNHACLKIISPTPTPLSKPTPTVTMSTIDSNSSVLGISIDNSKGDSWEPVRPTQFYERPLPTNENEKSVVSESLKSELRSNPEKNSVTTAKTSAVISAVVSFLTAGFIFIRIII